MAVAVRFAASQMTSTIDETESKTNGTIKIELHEKAQNFSLNENELPGPGYARRCGKSNDLFGARYISDYKEDVENLVEKGNKESSDKMQPGQMYEVIVNKYENRIFALPSEYEIRCFVGQVLNKKKRQDEDQLDEQNVQEDSENHASSEENNLFDKDFVKWAMDFISKNGSIK